MKTLLLAKAESTGDMHPEEVKIIIDSDLPSPGSFADLASIKNYYHDQATALADALLKALPQGIIEPLLIRLMERRVSLYGGVMSHKD